MNDADASPARVVAQLVADGVASGIAAGNPDLWGPDAHDEAAQRLGWTRLHDTSRPLVAAVEALRRELAGEGVDRVVLCGMGGSSLAPEVICRGAGVPLVVLDSTDPGQVRAALVDLDRTVVVVSSKSGGTVETDSQRRMFEQAFTEAGIEAARRIVVVTDPGSPLAGLAEQAGYRAVFPADPTVGGRYSALTAFGLVPSGLAGADVTALLDDAAAVAPSLGEDSAGNPALRLAVALAASPSPDGPRDKVVITEGDGPALPGFGDWAEQLVAESTGKHGKGVLPVVAGPGAPETTAPPADVVVARVSGVPGGHAVVSVDSSQDGAAVSVAGSLGAQFLLWEWAVAVVGRVLGINPFDQPDVESAKAAARELLDRGITATSPDLSDGDVGISGSPGLLDGVEGLEGATGAVSTLLDRVPARGYVAITAYLDREAMGDLPAVRDAVARRTGRPTTFGWGPRFLHSTGQYHKGGPAIGAFVQIVAGEGLVEDLAVPGRDFTFGTLIAAQAAGDARVLAQHHLPVLTLTVGSTAALSRVTAALSAQETS